MAGLICAAVWVFAIVAVAPGLVLRVVAIDAVLLTEPGCTDDDLSRSWTDLTRSAAGADCQPAQD